MTSASLNKSDVILFQNNLNNNKQENYVVVILGLSQWPLNLKTRV